MVRFAGWTLVYTEGKVRSTVNSWPNNAVDKADEALHYAPSPTTFKAPQISLPRKKPPLNPPLLPPSYPSFPTPRHPLSPPSHHSPSPCSRILLYKPGTDVCRGRAERPRCSGCQPHAFHSEMKAHSSPSCEANLKKKKKEGVEKNKLSKCLQVPSKVKTYSIQYEHTFLSPLHHVSLHGRRCIRDRPFFIYFFHPSWL